MNKTRREQLTNIYTKLDDLKSALSTLQEEEQDYYDNMPESLQSSEKGELAEAASCNLEEAVYDIEEALSKIEEAQT